MISLNEGTLWNVNPLVATVDDFLSIDQCKELIALAQDRLVRAEVLMPDGSNQTSDDRTNSTSFFKDDAEPLIIQQVKFMIGALIRLPLTHAESMQVLHYDVSQEFTPHMDGFTLAGAQSRIDRFEARGGQRLFSTMIYLNDVEEGGATSFPKMNLAIAPRRGRLLIFANTMAGSRDSVNLALHAGEPVIAGEKWSAITWWRERSREVKS